MEAGCCLARVKKGRITKVKSVDDGLNLDNKNKIKLLKKLTK